MQIEVTYGGGPLNLEVPAAINVDFFAPALCEQPVDAQTFSDRFLEAGGAGFLSDGPPLVVVNDAFRNTPTATLLGWLGRRFPDLISHASFIVSTGTHAPPTEPQYRSIFGDTWDRVRTRVQSHDCRDYSAMTLLGSDRLGGEIWVNRAIVESPRTLVIGSVEPHYFAGYTGGRKAVFPGLTNFDTVARNHNLANSLDAAPLRLQGNPVAEHLGQLMSTLEPDRFFAIQIVTDAEQKMAHVSCGRLDVAFAEAAAVAGRIYSHSVATPYEVVLCEILPPLDCNLYQAQKAVENCQAAVSDDGTIVVVSACRGGIGSRHFYDLADQWDPQTNQAEDGKEHFGSHKLSRMVAVGRRINVRLYSDLPGDIARKVLYEPLDNLQDFLYSRGQLCEICNMAVVRDAGHTVLQRHSG